MSTRINKFLSEAGYCSRRAADKLIAAGKVTINGDVPEMGTKVEDGDEVRVEGKLVGNSEEELVYLVFNKPVGVVCTTGWRCLVAVATGQEVVCTTGCPGALCLTPGGGLSGDRVGSTAGKLIPQYSLAWAGEVTGYVE